MSGRGSLLDLSIARIDEELRFSEMGPDEAADLRRVKERIRSLRDEAWEAFAENDPVRGDALLDEAHRVARGCVYVP